VRDPSLLLAHHLPSAQWHRLHRDAHPQASSARRRRPPTGLRPCERREARVALPNGYALTVPQGMRRVFDPTLRGMTQQDACQRSAQHPGIRVCGISSTGPAARGAGIRREIRQPLSGLWQGDFQAIHQPVSGRFRSKERLPFSRHRQRPAKVSPAAGSAFHERPTFSAASLQGSGAKACFEAINFAPSQATHTLRCLPFIREPLFFMRRVASA
jgi:hypothetical protein